MCCAYHRHRESTNTLSICTHCLRQRATGDGRVHSCLMDDRQYRILYRFVSLTRKLPQSLTEDAKQDSRLRPNVKPLFFVTVLDILTARLTLWFTQQIKPLLQWLVCLSIPAYGAYSCRAETGYWNAQSLPEAVTIPHPSQQAPFSIQTQLNCPVPIPIYQSSNLSINQAEPFLPMNLAGEQPVHVGCGKSLTLQACIGRHPALVLHFELALPTSQSL